MYWHTKPIDAVYTHLDTTENGLSGDTVTQRQKKHGPNALIEKGGRNIWKLLWEQVTSVMVLILLVAAILSGVLGDLQDAIVILAIVVFFVSLGVFQEYQAEQAIAALKKMTVPDVKIQRSGKRMTVPETELVPGDIVFLETGDQIPADLRLLTQQHLKVEEAALTGESLAVEKQIEALKDTELPVADRTNMLYMGTQVTYGRGKAVVVATGMQTELGSIADLLQNVKDRKTPLQQRLDHVGKVLAGVAIGFSGLIFGIGLWQEEALKTMALSAIAVAVAAVPEGLPAVLTVTLAFGAQRMLKRQALVRKLTGIETLGSVSIICSDKTGTLTQNKMTATRLLAPEHHFAFSPNKAAEKLSQSPLKLSLLCSVLCNNAELKDDERTGDPTELAMLQAAHDQGWKLEQLVESFPRIDELPFDSERKSMTTLHRIASIPDFLTDLSEHLTDFKTGNLIGFTKGSIDRLLDISENTLNDADKKPWQKCNQDRASEGERVLAFATRLYTEVPAKRDVESLEKGLVLQGLMSMIDPPRPEAKQAVSVCLKAGIQPLMITGDHPLTAVSIARQLNITQNNKVMTGREIEPLSQSELQHKLETYRVFARVSPEHKLRIVKAFQDNGKIVAMTGDGVNDAPALKQADIGVAMGITGTDVSKQAADMVLQDDNFATIVAAVEEGRIIYDNLRKFIKFSVAGNLGKIGVMLVTPLLGMPLALAPIQMLWLNLLTDGLLGFGIGLEKAEGGIMKRKPTPPEESIFGKGMIGQIVWMGMLIALISTALGGWSWFASGKSGPWQSILFTSLAFAQIFQALGIRSSEEHLWEIGPFSNPVLWAMIGGVIALQMSVIYIPFLQKYFHTQPLGLGTMLLVLAANALIWGVAEVIKATGKAV